MADAKRALRLKVRHKRERGGRRVTTNRPNPSKSPCHSSYPGKATNDLPSLEFGILSISAIPEDHCILRSILNDSQLRIVKSRTCKEAIARLCRRHMPVVICESDLPD